MKLKYLTSYEEKFEIENEREVHQRKADSARAGITFDGNKAKDDNKVTCIAFDLMKTLPTLCNYINYIIFFIE